MGLGAIFYLLSKYRQLSLNGGALCLEQDLKVSKFLLSSRSSLHIPNNMGGGFQQLGALY